MELSGAMLNRALGTEMLLTISHYRFLIQILPP